MTDTPITNAVVLNNRGQNPKIVTRLLQHGWNMERQLQAANKARLDALQLVEWHKTKTQMAMDAFAHASKQRDDWRKCAEKLHAIADRVELHLAEEVVALFEELQKS